MPEAGNTNTTNAAPRRHHDHRTDLHHLGLAEAFAEVANDDCAG